MKAREIAEREAKTFISPYNDAQIIAGQGTIGVELHRQLEQNDALFVAAGGGGLIAGIAGYLKSVAPDRRIVGCGPSIIGIAIVLIGLILFGSTFAAVATPDPAVRERMTFDDGWRFKKDDPPGIGDALSYAKTKEWLLPNGNELLDPAAPKPMPPVGQSRPTTVYTQPSFDDSSWRVLDLPHDWGVEGGFNQDYPGETGKLQWWGVGWYRKHFFIPPQDANKRVYLDLDGAMSYAIVWLNGGYVGGWPYGYSSWRVDLTNFLRFGSENVLAIRLDNPKHHVGR